jgi:DNA-binding CsgD family transcriptional regulator
MKSKAKNKNENVNDSNKVETIKIGDVVFTIPYKDLLSDPTPDEFDRFKEDIRVNGITIPVLTDEVKGVIDGGKRLKAASELGLKSVPVLVVYGLSQKQKKELAIKLNCLRRQMTKEQRVELAILLRKDGLSYRQIAEIVNVSHETIRRNLRTVINVTDEFPDKVKGKDGKERPAKVGAGRRPVIIAKNISEAKRTYKACDSLGQKKIPSVILDVKRVERIARNNEAEERRKGEYKDLKAGQAQLLLGDFRQRNDIEDKSVDLIFTDPPYDKKSLHLWDDVGRFAARTLKPGRLFASYSGVLYLPQVHEMLGRHLSYLWTAAIYHSGGKKLVSAVKVQQAWKPILIYYRPPLDKYWKPFTDMVSGGKAKSEHIWQQAAEEAAHYIKALCPKNGVVLDPMCGSGTTLVAGIKLGLECIGIEIDKAAFATAEERIKDAQGHLLEDCSEESNIQELDSF